MSLVSKSIRQLSVCVSAGEDAGTLSGRDYLVEELVYMRDAGAVTPSSFDPWDTPGADSM